MLESYLWYIKQEDELSFLVPTGIVLYPNALFLGFSTQEASPIILTGKGTDGNNADAPTSDFTSTPSDSASGKFNK